MLFHFTTITIFTCITITKYLGSDPEFSAANGVLYQGIDPGNVALSRTFTFGMKINL